MNDDYDQIVLSSIKEGDLKALRDCFIGPNEINRHFKPNERIIANPKYSPIKGPTLVIYSILCEQPHILQYLLEKKNPDLSIRVEGWAPIHYAAIVSDPSCLLLLLKCKFTHENPDYGIEFTCYEKNEKLTALHVAVSNHRYLNVYYLLNQYPEIQFGGDVVEDHVVSDLSIRSPSGNTPLHIAVYQNDIDMVHLILNHIYQDECLNRFNQTPLQYAISLGKEEIALLLKGDTQLQSIDSILSKYDPNYGTNDLDISDDEPDEEESSMPPQHMIHILQNEIERMRIEVQKVNDKVDNNTPVTIMKTNLCCHCRDFNTQKCELCGNYYCGVCRMKPNYHPCLNT